MLRKWQKLRKFVREKIKIVAEVDEVDEIEKTKTLVI